MNFKGRRVAAEDPAQEASTAAKEAREWTGTEDQCLLGCANDHVANAFPDIPQAFGLEQHVIHGAAELLLALQGHALGLMGRDEGLGLQDRLVDQLYLLIDYQFFYFHVSLYQL